jgi:hypothetical protein
LRKPSPQQACISFFLYTYVDLRFANQSNKSRTKNSNAEEKQTTQKKRIKNFEALAIAENPKDEEALISVKEVGL